MIHVKCFKMKTHEVNAGLLLMTALEKSLQVLPSMDALILVRSL